MATNGGKSNADAIVPAFGDDFRADPGGIAERDRKRLCSERVAISPATLDAD